MLGISVNPLEDVITDEYIETIKSIQPAYLRYPEGALSQNYFWATSPTWLPTSAQYICKNVWPATDPQFSNADGTPKMFDLDAFFQLCLAVKATPIIIVPLNAMFGSCKIPYSELSMNAKQLVEYVVANDIIYEIGNETTMVQSYTGYTDAATYAKYAEMLIRDMKSVKSNIKCIVNGNSPEEVNIVSKIPGIIGIALHNYPCYSVDDWLNMDSTFLVRKVVDCKAAANGKELFITETSSTNFTPQENTVGLSLMNIDILLRSLELSKCVLNWTTKWNYNMPIKPNAYCALSCDDSLTCLGHMIRLLSFAIHRIGENVVMKRLDNSFVFTNTVTNKIMTIAINKKNESVLLKSRKKTTAYTLYGSIDSKTPLFESYRTSGFVKLKPMSLTVIV
ncbi:Alpha-L-arabinofuranosidase [Only Syngen Nebraska virus 5]|uniref:Alpha-L-arabinofuranosidase n=1 Tax=Only Syngen Nebraska virus 5 TaxID=1917232 RepID=UPI000901C6E3|nr:Alpha-L-arabinofuranosidase [Only Syngen Nebraska virus 5]APC25868.1 Alpha-L-arabinofuranosidase [Only Syngen Nebraska virus 5]